MANKDTTPNPLQQIPIHWLDKLAATTGPLYGSAIETDLGRKGKIPSLFHRAIAELKDEVPIQVEERLTEADKDAVLAYILSRGYVRGLKVVFEEVK